MAWWERKSRAGLNRTPGATPSITHQCRGLPVKDINARTSLHQELLVKHSSRLSLYSCTCHHRGASLVVSCSAEVLLCITVPPCDNTRVKTLGLGLVEMPPSPAQPPHGVKENLTNARFQNTRKGSYRARSPENSTLKQKKGKHSNRGRGRSSATQDSTTSHHMLYQQC